MDTRKIPLIVFTLLFTLLLISPDVFASGPSDVIIIYPYRPAAAGNDSVITFDSVRNELSADGEWIKVTQDEIDSASVTGGTAEFDDDINTEYVWRPYNVDENWSPYTNGYWTYTNCGWMWVSYYQWGWRPYHYGRWWWSPRWGWVWSPGYIWAPAWVVWMFYDGYYGWYPLSPRVRWHHHHGYRCHHIRYRVRHWHFCHTYNFTNVYINHTVLIDPSENAGILKYSKFSSDIRYAEGIVTNKGPDVREVEKSAGKEIIPENVTKYNNTKQVNEYVKRNTKEQELKEKQVEETRSYQEKRERSIYSEKEVKREEKKNNREDTWEENPYYGTPKGDKEKKSEEKKNENVNKKEENNYNRQESPKYEAPKQEAPKHEQKNESPPPKKEDNSNKQNNENKSGNDNKHEGKR